MSIDLMTEVWRCQLARNEQLVALAMADWGNDDGTSIFPSVPRIAWKTGYSRRQVQTILRVLEEKDFLVVVAKASRHRPTEYRMETRAVAQKPPFKPRGAETSPLQGASRGAVFNARGAVSDNLGAQPTSPYPSEGNHQKEPPLAPTARKDELFEALAEVCYEGHNGLTRTERGRLNRAAKELREVQAKPEEVRDFGLFWPLHYPGIDLTPQAITGNWSNMKNGKLMMPKKARR